MKTINNVIHISQISSYTEFIVKIVIFFDFVIFSIRRTNEKKNQPKRIKRYKENLKQKNIDKRN